MIEYAISAGPGTLIDYGMTEILDSWKADERLRIYVMHDAESLFGYSDVDHPELDFIARSAAPDCVTGQ